MHDVVGKHFQVKQDHMLEDRCAPRTEVQINAQLRPSGSRAFAVVVKDISTSGFACDAVTTMRPGARCWLTIPGLEGLQAEVIRNDGITLGCAFSSLIHQVVLDRLMERHAPKSEKPALNW
jgi:PilZ domain